LRITPLVDEAQSLDARARALTVVLIMDGNADKALLLLADNYGVTKPRLKVGLPKGRRRNSLGCYNAKNRTIYVLNSDVIKQPLVILHEFYHHLRTNVELKHRGTEKNANRFAKNFIQAYQSVLNEESSC
jgi:hypothetical protein